MHLPHSRDWWRWCWESPRLHHCLLLPTEFQWPTGSFSADCKHVFEAVVCNAAVEIICSLGLMYQVCRLLSVMNPLYGWLNTTKQNDITLNHIPEEEMLGTDLAGTAELLSDGYNALLTCFLHCHSGLQRMQRRRCCKWKLFTAHWQVLCRKLIRTNMIHM